MRELVFAKLGGSVITDKSRPATARPECIRRLAGEVARSLEARPELQLVLGHGSGSFGHVVAQRYGTRAGVHTPGEWRGFAAVAASAARLNRMVAEALLDTGIPVWSLQVSSSAHCENGRLLSLDTAPIERALIHRLVPLVYGDVALDGTLGGTVISTEQILSFLARTLRPARIIFASAVDGVFERDPSCDPDAHPVPRISKRNWKAVRTRLSASRRSGASESGAADVTGAMFSKVEMMVRLARELPELSVYILSGERVGALETALRQPSEPCGGTLIRWQPEEGPESSGGR